MGVVTRKRPRRLVLVAAVIALAAALFVAIQAPLQAQSERRITIKVDHKNYFVTESQFESARSTSPPFTQRTSRGGVVTYPFDRGVSLDDLVRAARPRISPLPKVVDLTTDNGAMIHAARDANFVFFNDKSHGRFTWIKNKGNTTDRQVKSDTTVLFGRRGNLLDVDIEPDPENPRVDEEVTFTAHVDEKIDGEDYTYKWDFGDGDVDTTPDDSVTHTYSTRESFMVQLTVEGDKESVGSDTFEFRPRKKAKPPRNSGGNSGGSSSGNSGGSGVNPGGDSSGTPPSGSGALPPAGTTPPPTTPALPPPSSSPPSDPGRGPNLDPNAPPAADIPTGQEVSGILVSTGTPPRPGQAGAKAPNANAKNAKSKKDEFDWKLAGGIALTALLVILGAVRERGRLHRLLPQRPAPPQTQPQSG